MAGLEPDQRKHKYSQQIGEQKDRRVDGVGKVAAEYGQTGRRLEEKEMQDYTGARMICKSIDKLTEEVKRLRRVEEKRIKFECGVISASEMRGEEENESPHPESV